MENKSLFLQIVDILVALFSKPQSVSAPAPVASAPVPQADVSAPAPVVSAPSFTLKRDLFRDDGIISTLSDKDGNIVAHTLEHSYDKLPKIPNGVWKCQRGNHRLHNMTEDFSTFEVMNIPGHDNILFHWGNYNKDSDGCILMGNKAVESNGVEMVTSSKDTFAKFMASLDGVDEFVLTVS